MTAPSTPPAVEHLDDYLRRRARSGLALSPGEIVTLAVGVLRGCRRAERSQAGFWALTAQGCPVLVGDTDGDDALAATAAVLTRLADMTDHAERPLIERARDAVLTQPPRAWEDAERRLFAWADPIPLVLGPLAPIVDTDTGPVEGQARAASGLLAVVDADLATLVAEAVRDLRKKLRRVGRARWITFSTVAVVTALVLGLVLPTTSPASIPLGDASPSVSSSRGDRIPDAESPPTPIRSGHPMVLVPGRPTPLLSLETPTPTPSVTSAATEDIASAARDLLAAYAACDGEQECEQSLREGRPTGDEEPPMSPAVAAVGLVDDFGGLAVVRLDNGDRQQYVTIVRDEDRWLVRAVRAGADQPS